MKIAVLGTGTAARTLTEGLLAVGHTVRFGSRAPREHTELPAPVTTVEDAVAGADLVVSALLGTIALDALRQHEEVLAGHVLLDLGNAIIRPGFDLLYPNSSLGAQLQQALPRTRIVKTLNTVNLGTAIHPEALPSATSLFLSGDDAGAKTLVSGLLVDLGWSQEQQVDLGDISTARASEHYFLLAFTLMTKFRAPANIAVVHADPA